MAEKAVTLTRFNRSMEDLTEWSHWANESAGAFREELLRISSALRRAGIARAPDTAVRIGLALEEIETQFKKIQKDLRRIKGNAPD